MSLKTMAEAIMTALQTLKPTPCKHVGWYAGQVTRAGLAEEIVGQTPAILLANESEIPDADLSVTTITGNGRDAVIDVWRVYLVIEETRGTGAALVGVAAQVGLFALRDAVLLAINRLHLVGQLGNHGLEYQGTRPALVQSGIAYADAMTFAIARPIDAAVRTTPSQPLAGVDSHVNQDGVPANAKPMSTTRNSF